MIINSPKYAATSLPVSMIFHDGIHNFFLWNNFHNSTLHRLQKVTNHTKTRWQINSQRVAGHHTWISKSSWLTHVTVGPSSEKLQVIKYGGLNYLDLDLAISLTLLATKLVLAALSQQHSGELCRHTVSRSSGSSSSKMHWYLFNLGCQSRT